MPWLPPATKPRLRGVLDVFATFVAIPAGLELIAHARPGTDTAVAVIYACSLCLMLGWSGLYHTLHWPLPYFRWVQRIDHANIFFLIAGSYTPFVMPLPPELRTAALWVVWGAALVGILRALLFIRRRRALSAVVYVVVGLALLPIQSSVRASVGPRAFSLLAIGGGLYIIGAVIYALGRPNLVPRIFGYHELFHVFVFAAATCHFVAIWGLLVG